MRAKISRDLEKIPLQKGTKSVLLLLGNIFNIGNVSSKILFTMVYTLSIFKTGSLLCLVTLSLLVWQHNCHVSLSKTLLLDFLVHSVVINHYSPK